MPCTHQEQVEHSLAAERRRMRLIHYDIMQDLLNNKTFQISISEGKCLKWTLWERQKALCKHYAKSHSLNVYAHVIISQTE